MQPTENQLENQIFDEQEAKPIMSVRNMAIAGAAILSVATIGVGYYYRKELFGIGADSKEPEAKESTSAPAPLTTNPTVSPSASQASSVNSNVPPPTTTSTTGASSSALSGTGTSSTIDPNATSTTAPLTTNQSASGVSSSSTSVCGSNDAPPAGTSSTVNNSSGTGNALATSTSTTVPVNTDPPSNGASTSSIPAPVSSTSSTSSVGSSTTSIPAPVSSTSSTSASVSSSSTTAASVGSSTTSNASNNLPSGTPSGASGSGTVNSISIPAQSSATITGQSTIENEVNPVNQQQPNQVTLIEGTLTGNKPSDSQNSSNGTSENNDQENEGDDVSESDSEIIDDTSSIHSNNVINGANSTITTQNANPAQSSVSQTTNDSNSVADNSGVQQTTQTDVNPHNSSNIEEEVPSEQAENGEADAHAKFILKLTFKDGDDTEEQVLEYDTIEEYAKARVVMEQQFGEEVSHANSDFEYKKNDRGNYLLPFKQSKNGNYKSIGFKQKSTLLKYIDKINRGLMFKNYEVDYGKLFVKKTDGIPQNVPAPAEQQVSEDNLNPENGTEIHLNTAEVIEPNGLATQEDGDEELEEESQIIENKIPFQNTPIPSNSDSDDDFHSVAGSLNQDSITSEQGVIEEEEEVEEESQRIENKIPFQNTPIPSNSDSDIDSLSVAGSLNQDNQDSNTHEQEQDAVSVVEEEEEEDDEENSVANPVSDAGQAQQEVVPEPVKSPPMHLTFESNQVINSSENSPKYKGLQYLGKSKNTEKKIVHKYSLTSEDKADFAKTFVTLRKTMPFTIIEPESNVKFRKNDEGRFILPLFGTGYREGANIALVLSYINEAGKVDNKYDVKYEEMFEFKK